ncbi:MAG: hypothetical protein J6P38_07505 [Acetobacter sp.]|nr:hypothetical protein [Acetobacter sp.]
MKIRQKKYVQKIVLLNLALFLAGCAGSGFGTWNNNWNNNSWNNITGGVRNYGQYPIPNAQTCFTNPTLVAAKQQGLDNLEFQKAAEGISKITLVRDELIPATNQLFVQNNPQPLNTLYAQIQPQTLANFMIGCNEVIVKERAQLIQERQQLVQERQQLVQDANNLSNKIATLQNYLNTTPAPQPTLQTSQDSYVIAHPEIGKAENSIAEIYEAKPMLLFLTLTLYTPVDQLNTLLNINTIQGLQNFQQQLQQRHLMTDGALPPPPPAPPPINWEKYKITFTQVENLKITTAQTIQGLQKIHQQLQSVHQQLQSVHQQLQRVHSTNVKVTAAEFGSPQAILNTFESLPYHGTSGSLGVINYQKAVIASQNGNYMPLIAIYKQAQPQTWQNYFVNYYTLGQKYHNKAKVNMH